MAPSRLPFDAKPARSATPGTKGRRYVADWPELVIRKARSGPWRAAGPSRCGSACQTAEGPGPAGSRALRGWHSRNRCWRYGRQK